MAKRKLHPALQARSQAVAAAHSHLKANQPGFTTKKPHEQFKAVQDHIRKGGSR